MLKKFLLFRPYIMLLKYIKELKIIFYLHQTKKVKFFGMNYYIIQKKILHILQLIKYLIDTNLIILYFIILFSHINVSKKIDISLLNSENYIIMNIQGALEQPILNNEIIAEGNFILPNKIKINEGPETDITENIVQGLTLENNTIKLIWNNNISTFLIYRKMFKGLTNIINIDLTRFDFSNANSLESFFEGCNSLKSIDLSNADLKNVQNMNFMFRGCTSLISINFSNTKTNKLEKLIETFFGCENILSIDLSSFDTPNLLDLSNIFQLCHSLKYINLENFNTSKVTNMNGMFSNCKSLESLNLSFFNTESVIYMDRMFDQCNSLTSLDLSVFYTQSLISIYAAFSGCKKLEYLEVCNFDTTSVENMGLLFNECCSLKSLNLSNFNTPSLTNIFHMFWGCNELEFLDINHFNTNKITDMQELFMGCKSLKSLNLSNFDTALVENMIGMFQGCKKLLIIDLSSFKTEAVTQMDHMFGWCNSLKSLNLNNFYTPNLGSMSELFLECTSLESLDISNFNTSKITDMSNLFLGCESLKYLIQNFDTSSVTQMGNMFLRCKKLEILNISNFNTESVKSMFHMFDNCQSLMSLDISNFHTPLLENMEKMFLDCLALTSLDISNLDTSKIKNMDYLFNNCVELKSLNLSNFNTSSTVGMSFMFNLCRNLRYLDISNFDTSNVSDMGHMFGECNSLTSLNLSNFNTTLVTNIQNMFYNCYTLEALDITNFNTEKITNLGGLFINCNNLKTLNLSNFVINDENIIIGSMIAANNPNLILCFNKSMMPSSFLNEVSQYENNCLKVCLINSKKFILKNEMCVENCNGENIDKYEYQNICYPECPIRTYLINNSTHLCEDCPNYYINDNNTCIDIIPEGYYLNDTLGKIIYKCPSKCRNCLLESIIDNLCISCNENYYPKLIYSSINRFFYECNNISEEDGSYNLNISYNSEIIEGSKGNKYKNSEFVNNYINTNSNNYELINTHSTNIEDYVDNSSFNNYINRTNINDKKEYTYLYEVNPFSEEIKKNFTHTYIDIEEKVINFLKNKFLLDEEDKIYMTISETTKNDSYMAIIDYIYKYTLENGENLNLSSIEEDIYINIYVPIIDLELAKFDLNKHFAEQGYDIYDINSKFYNDFCDITLTDRKKDIYPNNITLCKSNCKYSGVNIEEKRVICTCNLNPNKSYDNEEKLLDEDDGNFVTYLLDNINYKIFECYSLFFDYENLMKSYPFYIIIIIFFIIQIIDFIYIFYTLRRLKIIMAKEMPVIKNEKERIIEYSKKFSLTQNINKMNNAPKKKKSLDNNKNNSKSIRSNRKSENNLFIYVLNNNKLLNNINLPDQIKGNNNEKRDRIFKDEDNKNLSKDYFTNLEKEEDINELPYTKAIIVDKRNVFQIFYSFIIDKLEFISILFSNNKIKIILFAEYIMSLLINFFFNALLYSDEVVSNKYHNNGELDFLVSLLLSILSNVITSIFCYYLKYSNGVEERINLILDLRNDFHFYRNLMFFLSRLKLKFICFYIFQLIIFWGIMYYIVIFCVLYSCSQTSLIINYCYSLVESIITSIVISLIILVTRKIGIICKNKNFYNISKYINKKF